ncbi:MAG TPA: tetratricopeptide repeat protein [Mycobacteriales bacterium]|nr:tetratricopeptide repeat protein [Mycobacteriales bacterium]
MTTHGETAPSYLPIDRRLALLAGHDLPTEVTGTALDADLSGFTALTEALADRYGEQRGAEELARRLNLMYDGLITCVHRYGGTVLGFAGDAFSCWLDGDDGRRGIACGLALQEWMGANAREVSGGLPAPQLKVALATGRTRRFLVGNPRVQLLEGLAGALVDELAAAGHDAEPGQIVLAPSTRAAVGEQVRTDARGALQWYEGRAEPSPWPAPDETKEGLDAVRAWLLPAVFTRLAAGEGDFLAELRPATALFMRISGIRFEDDPAALDRLDEIVRTVQAVLSSYDGTLVQLTIGDKGSYLYAAFGAPVAHEDDQVRALLAALELRELGGVPGRPELVDPVSIGLASGRLRAGSYGGTERRTYGVLGDTVNLAARLMQAAGAGEIVCTRALQTAAGDGFRWSPMAELTVKGKREPIAVAQLVGSRAVVPQPRRPSADADPGPMLGRADELAALAANLDAAVGGRGRIVAVTAEAGMGKSRLVAELAGIAERRGIAVHHGECPSYGVNSSYLVWQPVWGRLFGLGEADSEATRLAAVGKQLEVAGPALAHRLPVLGPVIGAAAPDNELTASFDAKARKTALETTLVEWLRAEIDRPVVVVLEDCHWIDPLSEDLLTAIGRVVRELPVLLLVTQRQRSAAEGGALAIHGLPHFRELRLDRLSDHEVELMIRRRLESVSISRATAEAVSSLAGRAEGNPFYVEELLDYLLEIGAGGLDPERLAELPSTLQSLVLSRIDRLAERPRSVLKVASAVGRTFGADLLPEVHAELGSDALVTSALATLRGADFIVAEDVEHGRYGFRHAITQEVAYSTIVETTRAALHGRIGRTLERRAGDATDRVLDLLAHHFARGDDEQRRRTYVLRAAEAAEKRWANRAAAEYFSNVLPLLGAEQRGDVLLKLGRALSLTGRLDEAAAAFAEAFATGSERDDAVLKARAQTEQGELHRKQGRYDEAAADFAAARDRLEAEHHRAGVAEVLHLEGTLAAQRGDTALARRRFEDGLDIRRTVGDRRGVSRALNGLGIVAEYENDLGRAANLYAEALEINVEIGDQWGVAAVTNNQGYALLLQGAAAEALPLFERAVALEREVGDPSMLANFLSNLGDAHRELGEHPEATAAYDEALALAQELDERWLVCYLLEDVAVLCAREGRAAEAMQLAAAGSALRVAIGAPLPAESVRLLDARLQPARAALPDDAYDAARASGSGWSFEEAIDHAVRAGRAR